MHFDIFSQGHSIFHSIDPRIKIIVYIPLVFMIALLQNVNAAFFYFFLAIVFILIANFEIKEIIPRIVFLNVFIICLWLTLPFNIEGTVLFQIRDFSCSFEGLLYTFLITLKANTILLFTISLIGTTDIFALAHALFHLKFPRKLVYLTIFLYRYISVLHSEYDRLTNTVKARSFSPRANMNTLKTYAYMIGMLFVNSYERSQRIYQALVLRGFRGDFPMLRHFRFHKQDILFGLALSFLILIRFVIWK